MIIRKDTIKTRHDVVGGQFEPQSQGKQIGGYEIGDFPKAFVVRTESTANSNCIFPIARLVAVICSKSLESIYVPVYYTDVMNIRYVAETVESVVVSKLHSNICCSVK